MGKMEHSNTMNIRVTVRGLVVLLIAMILVIAGLMYVDVFIGESGLGRQVADGEREKLNTGYEYMEDCILDEVGCIDKERLTDSLRRFYEDTGCQPFVWVCTPTGFEYTNETFNNSVNSYYDSRFSDRQDVVMFVYYGDWEEENSRVAVVTGELSRSVFDTEAEGIFLEYFNKYKELYSNDMSNILRSTFLDTSRTIMTHGVNIYGAIAIIALMLIELLVAGVYVVTKQLATYWKSNRSCNAVI